MSAPQITHIGTVVVPVAEQDRALAYYTGTLGFETRIDAELAPGQRGRRAVRDGRGRAADVHVPRRGRHAVPDRGARLTQPAHRGAGDG
jgi:catechol 2,3-dioxygenase-like lactoylglutathione lyase family enzyme